MQGSHALPLKSFASPRTRGVSSLLHVSAVRNSRARVASTGRVLMFLQLRDLPPLPQRDMRMVSITRRLPLQRNCLHDICLLHCSHLNTGHEALDAVGRASEGMRASVAMYARSQLPTTTHANLLLCVCSCFLQPSRVFIHYAHGVFNPVVVLLYAIVACPAHVASARCVLRLSCFLVRYRSSASVSVFCQ